MTMSILLGSYGGYIMGKSVSNKEDNEKYLTDFINEDQMFYLIKKEQKPIYFYYYGPGDWLSLKFREPFLKQAKKHHEECFFMKINCCKHYDFCRNKDINQWPKVQLMTLKQQINENDEISESFITSSSQKELSQDGIESFLLENGVLENTYAEQLTLNKNSKIIDKFAKIQL